MKHFPDPAPGSTIRWVMLVIGVLNFIMSMFYRVSTAVISPALVSDLGLTSSQLADLAGAFYYAFACSQLALGISIDRLGARVTMGLLALAGIAGAVLFAVGQTASHLILARALLGIGMSGNLMVVLALLAAWFPVDRFGFLSGLVVSAGTAGNLIAATPLTLLSIWLGWRGSFVFFAALNALVVCTFLLVMRDRPHGAPAPLYKSGSIRMGLLRLFGSYSYWAISLSNFVRYGYFAALQSLWVGPFLVYGLGLGEIAASNAILFMGLGYMAGLPIAGSLSDKTLRSRKKVAFPAMAGFCLITVAVAWLTQATALWVVLVVFFWLGVLASPGQIMYAHMKELVPASMIAQAMTSVNLFTVLGAGIMTHVLGMVIGQEPSALAGPEGFRLVWYVGAAALLVVTLLYGLVPDSQALGTTES